MLITEYLLSFEVLRGIDCTLNIWNLCKSSVPTTLQKFSIPLLTDKLTLPISTKFLILIVVC